MLLQTFSLLHVTENGDYIITEPFFFWTGNISGENSSGPRSVDLHCDAFNTSLYDIT